MNSSHTTKEIKEKIVECLNEMGITVKNIILFGSRARGDFQEESDWDILIITKNNLSQNDKKNTWQVLNRSLHENFYCTSFDIIVKSEEEYENEKHIVNTISNEAYLEGVKM